VRRHGKPRRPCCHQRYLAPQYHAGLGSGIGGDLEVVETVGTPDAAISWRTEGCESKELRLGHKCQGIS